MAGVGRKVAKRTIKKIRIEKICNRFTSPGSTIKKNQSKTVIKIADRAPRGARDFTSDPTNKGV
jgi:hypothetical protein